MAPHSSTLAWKIPWMEEPGRLQSTGSQRVGHDWATSLSCIGKGNGNLLQCSCLENPRDSGAWWAAVYGVTQSWTRLKWLSSSGLQSMAMQSWTWLTTVYTHNVLSTLKYICYFRCRLLAKPPFVLCSYTLNITLYKSKVIFFFRETGDIIWTSADKTAKHYWFKRRDEQCSQKNYARCL